MKNLIDYFGNFSKEICVKNNYYHLTHDVMSRFFDSEYEHLINILSESNFKEKKQIIEKIKSSGVMLYSINVGITDEIIDYIISKWQQSKH